MWIELAYLLFSEIGTLFSRRLFRRIQLRPTIIVRRGQRDNSQEVVIGAKNRVCACQKFLVRSYQFFTLCYCRYSRTSFSVGISVDIFGYADYLQYKSNKDEFFYQLCVGLLLFGNF